MESIFAAKVSSAIANKDSRVMVGLDPQLDSLPQPLVDACRRKQGGGIQAVASAYREFCFSIIEAVAPHAVAVKPQLACFEEYGPEGLKVLKEVAAYAKDRGLLVVADGKRNDIGHTADVYARTYLGEVGLCQGKTRIYELDALTVNPYLGTDGLAPFIKACTTSGRGLFVLVKTSNPSSAELQDLTTPGEQGEAAVFERVADLLAHLTDKHCPGEGYGPLGAVVGATYPEQLSQLRRRLPRSIFLVPGFGAQGGGVVDILPAFDQEGGGALINSARGIIYAYSREPFSGRWKPDEYAAAAEEAVKTMKDEINSQLDCD